MTTPKTAGKRPGSRSAKTSLPSSAAKRPQRRAAEQSRSGQSRTPPAKDPKKNSVAASGERTVPLTLPGLGEAATWAAKAAAVPVSTARRVLPAKGGLPLYAGLGALAVAGALSWPVAVGVGIGYAVLRDHGLLAAPATSK
ncbi:hypothetical protein [Streptomyces jeddahensis]|uniref:Uncharacterized protein n=1 Tax=Streptomyces jeddahensis TaxID=1716141 RepID=A0A177HSL9_9ACTN|nr:hypothetical protein [Streptomyces jeddahensis]OAH13716.1 hypothetical protein STSP_30700 [Streptomyces jeddahensis]